MERWVGRVAVVTGASGGIGAAIAYQLQDAGLHVVALARRVEKIEKAVEEKRKAAHNRGRTSIGKSTTPGKLHGLKCDITKEEDILAAFEWIKDNLGSVHILVNNAGKEGENHLYDTETDQWRSILDVNVLGLSICTREALQLMKAKGVDDGHIIHIGSKYFPTMPGFWAYQASKQAVLVLTEGLRKELVASKSKIRVTIVRPGFVNPGEEKDFVMNSDTLSALGISSKENLWNEVPQMQTEDIADVILYAISTPPHVQIHEVVIHPVGEM